MRGDAAVAVAVAVLAVGAAFGAGPATVATVAGRVDFRLAEGAQFEVLGAQRQLPSTASLRTGADGVATIQYEDGSHITVKPGSLVQVGGPDASLWVSLGSVLVRASHLLDADLQVRTPVAVAAVRGTEFGVHVGETGRTRVYVFQGLVAVRNAQLPMEVLVPAGQMTRVEPLRPPTAPAPFTAAEFDLEGHTGRLERAEDPVLESTEEPAVDSWMAFADPDIDALRNPAFLAAVRAPRSTSLLSASLLRSRDRVDEGAGWRDAERTAADGQVGQHVTLWPAGGAAAGLFLEGARSHDDVTAERHLPFQVAGERRRQTTDRTVGRAHGIVAFRPGGHEVGLGFGYRHSRTDVEDEGLDGGGEPSSAERTHLARIQAGWLARPAPRCRLAVGWSHDLLRTSADADALTRTSDGYADAGELLFRQEGDDRAGAALLRLEHSRTDEGVSGGGVRVYDERLDVRAVRGGVGVGLAPAAGVLVGVDAVGGVSREVATQKLPGGGTREHEHDRRGSLNLHVGAQLFPYPWLVLTTDVNQLLERTDKEFDLLPGGADASRRRESTTASRATAATGAGVARGGWVLEYLLSGGGARPLAHNVLLVRNQL